MSERAKRSAGMPQTQDKAKAVGDHPPLQILSLYHRDMPL